MATVIISYTTPSPALSTVNCIPGPLTRPVPHRPRVESRPHPSSWRAGTLGRPPGVNGLRTRRPSCGHHAEGLARAVAGRQLILRAVRRYAPLLLCDSPAPPWGLAASAGATLSPAAQPGG